MAHRYDVDEELICNSPNAGFDMRVICRGSIDATHSFVYDPKSGGQFVADNSWLRRPLEVMEVIK